MGELQSLVEKFEAESELQIQLMESKKKKIQWVEPPLSAVSNLKTTTVNMDEEAENYTLKVLNNSFGKENIKVLKRQLERAEDEQQKLEIKAEIEFWESVV